MKIDVVGRPVASHGNLWVMKSPAEGAVTLHHVVKSSCDA